MFLLDTDTVIYALKGHKIVKKYLPAHLHDPMKISVITLMELYFGAHKSQRVTGNLAKVRKLESAMEVIPVGSEQAEIFGIHKARLQQSGNRLDDFDLIVAACAPANNLVLVTNNERHFQRIEGLKIINRTEELPPQGASPAP